MKVDFKGKIKAKKTDVKTSFPIKFFLAKMKTKGQYALLSYSKC